MHAIYWQMAMNMLNKKEKNKLALLFLCLSVPENCI